mgnify:CR=1 FL=1
MKVFNSYVFLLLLLLTGSASALSAQNRAISGRVLDALQEPLIGEQSALKAVPGEV